MTAVKDKSTPEHIEFWRTVSKAAATVASWPSWKKGGGRSTDDHTRKKPMIKPRYDDVYFEGLEWLDSLS